MFDKNEYQNKIMRERKTSSRDIGDIPAVVNPRRRQRCKRNLLLALKTYFRQSFPLQFSEDHKKVIRSLETVLLHGGLFAFAMPRSSGKTTIAQCALLWAALYGHRRYQIVVTANHVMAHQSLKDIKRKFESSKEIQEDFPEIAFPVRKLDGIPLRANGQLCRRKPTGIQWGSNIVFPTVDESIESGSAGCLIESVGITASFRGKVHTLADGSSVRPEFVMLDDPQDRGSADSLMQTDEREQIIQADILGLSGMRKDIASVCLCTVIKKDDLADKLLSHKKHPEWQGKKVSMVKKMPDAKESLWVEYFILRREGLADGDRGKAADAFYRKNKKAMDKGGEVYWTARHGKGKTALQTAMDLLCDRGEEAFASEFQNEPVETVNNMTRLDEEQVLQRINNLPRYEIPQDAAFILGGVDINLYGLTFCVAAFRTDWTCYVIDYGMTTDGGKQRDEMTDAQYVATMLTATLNEIDQRPYAARLNGILIDRGYMPDAVKSVLKTTKKRYSLAASLGRATTNYKPSKDARRAGNGWFEKDMDGVLTVTMNADIFKVQCHRAFQLVNGVQGGASLWQDSTKKHRTFAQQITNEFLCGVDDNGKHDWRQKVGSRHDMLDAAALCYVGASVMGCGSVQRVRQQARKQGPRKATYSEV